MNTELKNMIPNQLAKIFSLLEKQCAETNAEGLLSKYILLNNKKLNCNICNAEWIEKHKLVMSQGDHVKLALLGYTICMDPNRENKKIFEDGIAKLVKRDLFSDRYSFPFIPKLFLGIVLGVKALSENEKHYEWIKKTYGRRMEEVMEESQKLQYFVIGAMIDDEPRKLEHSFVEELKRIEDLAIIYWGCRNDIFSLYEQERTHETIKKHILREIVLNNVESYDEFLLVFVYDSVSHIINGSTTSYLMTQDHVSRILNNFESAMKRWVWKEDKKWIVGDEKDVQCILYLILRSIFDDVEYEEPTNKFGHKSSIVDLKIPSLKLLIEVKFVRQSSDFNRIENEIKIDSVDYIKSTNYRKIILFIYDNSSSVQDHDITRNAMKQIESIEDVIIVSRSSHMME